MKKIGIFMLSLLIFACQGEKKTTGAAASATVPDSLSFSYDSVKVYSRNAMSKDKQITDTSKAVISYPVFTDEQINAYVRKKILATADSGTNYTSYQEYASGFIKGFDDFQKTEDRPQTWFLDISARVVRQQPGYLSLKNAFVSFQGGAHPNSVFLFLNYDTRTHQEIRLDSLLLPGALPKLTRIAESIFRKQEKLSPEASLADGYFFENSTFKLNDNFSITDQGLKFLYNPYEIKAYAFGTTELLIPFAALKDIAQPHSLLSPSR